MRPLNVLLVSYSFPRLEVLEFFAQRVWPVTCLQRG